MNWRGGTARVAPSGWRSLGSRGIRLQKRDPFTIRAKLSFIDRKTSDMLLDGYKKKAGWQSVQTWAGCELWHRERPHGEP